MIRKLLEVLKVPESDSERVQSLLTSVMRGAIVVAAICFIAMVQSLLGAGRPALWMFSGPVILGILYGLHQLGKRGRISLATNLFLVTSTIFAAIVEPLSSSVASFSLPLYAIVVILAAMFFPPAASLIWGGIVTVPIIVRIILIASSPDGAINITSAVLGVAGLQLISLMAWEYGRLLGRIRSSLRQQIQQSRASVEIGHTVTAALDAPSVIRQAVQLIHDAFDYYHVGLFLVDPEGRSASLQDAAGAAADILKERGFSVALDGTSAVAAAINQRRRRKVVSWEESLDPRGRTIQFTYERLRSGIATRSELAIPLQVGDRVFGALDIHSTELDPFQEEDIHTLEGLIGNVANALEGARLLDDVQQRHQELTTIYDQTERRARYLEATAELARATSALLEPQELLDRAVDLVSEALGLYHTGIFLTNETREWAVLVAASSEGGKQMLARGHRLRVGEQGIVGWVTDSGQARIALNVGEDTRYFDNPDLPETRSEIALPLVAGEQVIGALDVQSTEEAAFGEEDAAVLQTLADQIAVAIQNARLFQQTQEILEEVQTLQRHYVAQEWQRITTQRSSLAAEYRTLGTPPIEEAWTPEMEMALDQEVPIVVSDLSDPSWKGDGGDGAHSTAVGLSSSQLALSALAIPIKLRDEVIGVLDLHETDEHRQWTPEEVEMASTIADQLALALENARLVEETQRKAAQLEAASEVARDATAILDVNQLLEETALLISEQFGYYHAGVFLLDDEGEYAILRAASSSGGQQMLERVHKLKVGEVGIVGYVAGTGEPRVVSDVDVDAVWYNAPELPGTRSEMGLPLKVRERVIGVLDVQSAQHAAFSDDDVAVLQILADQLATAIENASLFQRVREDANRRTLINNVTQAAASSLDIDELFVRAGEAIAQANDMPCIMYEWDAVNEVLTPVAVYDPFGRNITPDEPQVITAEMDPAIFQTVRTRQLQVLFDVPGNVSGVAAQLAQQLGLVDIAYIPLMSRDQVLGLLGLGRHQGHPPLDEGELSFLEVVATNLGVALENARLYQDAVETAERLQEVDRLKSQFLANMSHELRTPLNSIIGFSRVILRGIDGPITDMQRTDLETIHTAGQHLLELINDILDISKIVAGKMEVSFEDVNLPTMFASVMSTASGLVKDKPIELREAVAEGLPIIRGDERRIRQVLINIIGNAVKFTEQGYIEVGARANDAQVTIWVKDTGIGIPEDKLDTIFEEFTQVDGSSTRRAGGTGLGLSISRHFIELHGGRIWVESTLGVGSIFYFSLPITGPSAPEEEGIEELEAKIIQGEAPTAVEKPREQVGRLVLCVEDDEGVITLFRRYLSKQGYQVVGLTDPTRVMEEVKRLHPYAITLDVMMPSKDGWDVIQELKADPETHDIPVVMCTIVAEQGRGMSLGAADYLVKPVIERELVAALDRLNREEGYHLVLIVDDQKDHRDLLRRMIESQDGYEVVEASGGQEAIDLLQQVRPHIIMLDLMMPEMDGFAVLETLKANESTRSIPIVVVTAKELTDDDRDKLNSHVAALVQKGLMEREELLKDVAAALRKLTRHLP